MWQTAADSTDVISWTRRDNFVTHKGVPGVEFDRGKTGVPTFIPISRDLADAIAAAGTLYLVTDPQGRPYNGYADDSRLRGHLGTLRDYAEKIGGRRLIFDHIRHSAATEAEECGVPLDDIRHLTAHVNSDMNRSVYVQQSAAKTIEIQRARGII
jgi:integrase